MSYRVPGRTTALCVLLLMLGVSASWGQETAALGGPGVSRVASVAPTITRDATGRVTVRAVRISAPPTIDGTLTEDLYAQIPVIDGFIQQEPREGQPATQRTEVWVLYDDANVYVAARCWSTDPDRIVANDMRRDGTAIIQNDNFGVLFDTFHDRRSGFMFYTNALGALGDSLVTDERDTNRDWNTVWDVRTARFDGGWTVEMVLPFRSLRYPGPGTQDWGIQFRRICRGVNESSYLTPMPASFGQRAMVHVSKAAALVGLEAPRAVLNLEVKPYGLGKVQTNLGAARPYANDMAAAGGVDAKYTTKNGFVADATFNTDFAQVEDDEQQVNLTPFGLFFPERRDFFLEGAGVFAFGGASVSPRVLNPGPPSNTPILFYSRRIGLFEHGDEETDPVPILGGVRLTGRAGGYTVGVVDIQQREEPTVGAPATNFAVVRVKRDVLKQSSVGAIFTNRSQAMNGPGTNQSMGVDASFTFLTNLTINSYYARTRTGGDAADAASYRADVQWNGDRYGFEGEHLTVEDHFSPDVGFMRREDFRRNYGMFRFSPRPKAPSAIRKYQFEASADHFTDMSGRLETQELRTQAGMDLQNGDEWRFEVRDIYQFLSEPFEIVPGIVLPVAGYRFTDSEARYTFGPQRRFSGTVSAGGGQFFDGTRTLVGYRGRIEVSSKLSVEPGLSFNWVDLVEGSFLSKLLTARVTYSLSPRTAVAALVQYNSAGNVMGANARFRWEFRPGSDFFVVYSEGRDTSLGVAQSELRNRTIAIKLTRLFRF